MIKKYAKYFALLYVILIMDYFRVDSIGNPFDQYMPQQFFQSKIVEVRLDIPNDTIIVDPFMSVVKLYVFTNDKDTIWGTQNPFADSLIHFSLNNTYLWSTGDITAYDDPSNRYDCYSSGNYFFDAPLNTLFFHASYIENAITIDTIITIPVHYAKPLVSVLSINDVAYDDQTLVVNSNTDVDFEINLNRTLDYQDPAGYDKIIALEARHNGEGAAPYTQVWNDPQGVRDFTVTIPLSSIAAELIPGYNIFEFRARGKCANSALNEFSEIITIKIFYLDFMWNEELSSPVCQDNTVYELTGIPEGGYFSGEGVIASTTLYNPSLATPGVHTITYHLLVEGAEYTVGKELELTALPDFQLTGDREVCLNEYDVSYIISPGPAGYDQITWDNIEGGRIQSLSGDHSQAIIHWHGQGSLSEMLRTGKITVKMEKDGCMTSKEFLIDIGNTKAPDTSFMMLYNHNLLLCSDTSANYFYWYQNGELLQTTQVPYCFLGESFAPAAGAQFYVMTAFELNDAACLTQSNIYLWPGDKNIGYTLNQSDLVVCPNPNDGNFTVIIPDMDKNEYFITVSDLTGKVITSMSLNPATGRKECMIHGNNWPAGIYLLRLEGYATSLYKKIVINK
ncbi:MAG: T9SS type A sorting domain-containing protein [Bacteroidetes bacterium]|nr:T9SS type A sorting domain-containing protein [Bacteroidota bacterium]